MAKAPVKKTVSKAMTKTASKAPSAPSKKSASKTPSKAPSERKGLIKVTLTRSLIGRLKSHKACIVGLGLRRIRHTVSVQDTPCNRGMINKVSYMLKVEEG